MGLCEGAAGFTRELGGHERRRAAGEERREVRGEGPTGRTGEAPQGLRDGQVKSSGDHLETWREQWLEEEKRAWEWASPLFPLILSFSLLVSYVLTTHLY